MKKWTVVQVTDQQLEDTLNRFEANGWIIFSIDFSGYPRIVMWQELPESKPAQVPHKKKA